MGEDKTKTGYNSTNTPHVKIKLKPEEKEQKPKELSDDERRVHSFADAVKDKNVYMIKTILKNVKEDGYKGKNGKEGIDLLEKDRQKFVKEEKQYATKTDKLKSFVDKVKDTAKNALKKGGDLTR